MIPYSPAVAASSDGADPVAGSPLIDREHLRRMTLGDPGLEREVLGLFVRQAAILLARMSEAAPAEVAANAHTLKGSANGIGAWQVATAAAVLELAATVASERGGLSKAQAGLAAAVREATDAIANLGRSA
jgi:HPt (histidine-containing phosphotransfer) domain-containing protein